MESEKKLNKNESFVSKAARESLKIAGALLAILSAARLNLIGILEGAGIVWAAGKI